MAVFFWGVVSSLVASVIFVVGGWFGSKKARAWLVRFVSRLTGVGIERVHATQAVANSELSGELAQARWVKVFAGRGNELTRDSFNVVWANVSARLESVEILLPDPDISGSGSWLALRESEVSRHDRGFGNGLLQDQIRANVSYINARAQTAPGVELRLYDFPHLCRIIATDRVAYLTTYTDREHGRNSPCLVFRRPSAMYEFALRTFSVAWKNARPSVPSGRA